MKQELINVFLDTKKYSENLEPSESILYNDRDIIEIVKPLYNNSELIVENVDTVSCARIYSSKGKTVILNMASHKTPGGGVRNGAKAQEECLFRCSNLINSITSNFYPLDISEAIYTKNAIFFKDFYYNKIDHFKVDVITIPALNMNSYDDYRNYEKVTKNKIDLMLYMAYINEAENIILGAFGCGVFKNDPSTISLYFNEFLNGKYKNAFNNVIFAIINDHNSVSNNYEIFKNNLKLK